MIDPDKFDENTGQAFLQMPAFTKVDFIFVGGSLITGDNFGQTVQWLRQHVQKPIIIFPGSNMHIDMAADAILFLSLISGRNPDFLIGQQIVAAPILKRSNLEVLPTGYMLVESGRQTTVSYISNTTPIPHDKPEVAACTALAGEMLGLQLIYADGGSGAEHPISAKMISMIRKSVDAPIIIGGGINTPERAQKALQAGADVIVVGNAIEKDAQILEGIVDKVAEMNEENN
ncbi:geranylgeranylglyceryl phosphate synthase [Microscilla marina ATCC 23134]|uniref:Geranylgeranylglyceryl phosphate synthase n=1 Tax=Microscilla marina ATCC 23134 TaxID=313606 RepID=A1ZRU6_MICM2|nr:geranylgeranylglyceryl phosphate synthase [Microscilla marina ATCC 23134]